MLSKSKWRHINIFMCVGIRNDLVAYFCHKESYFGIENRTHTLARASKGLRNPIISQKTRRTFKWRDHTRLN